MVTNEKQICVFVCEQIQNDSRHSVQAEHVKV
jgi:hypothetical protein